MNPDMKPSLMPCFLRKASPYSFLRFIYPDMSTSLKVVNIALVFWASLSLSAILSLILLIATLVSVLVPWIPTGAFLETFCAGLPGDEGGGVTGAALAAGVGGAYISI